MLNVCNTDSYINILVHVFALVIGNVNLVTSRLKIILLTYFQMSTLCQKFVKNQFWLNSHCDSQSYSAVDCGVIWKGFISGVLLTNKNILYTS